MEPVLTKQNLRSTRFLRDEMFRCTRPGDEDPTDENWMCALYQSILVENGIELRITSDDDVFRVIKPFTERLYRNTFYHRESINGDYKLFFQVVIKTLIEDELVLVGIFYYRSDRNPFVPERVFIRRNLNLTEYLNQPFFIGIRTKLQRLSPTYKPDDVESSLPKPLKNFF